MKEQVTSIPGAQQKIDEYIERIKAGKESKESVLRDLPPSFTSAIEAGLRGGQAQEAPSEKPAGTPPAGPSGALEDLDSEHAMIDHMLKQDEEQDKISAIREQLTTTNTLACEGLENMKSVLDKIGETHYIFTHQTEEDVAQDIFNSKFHVSPGTGISSTMTWLGPEMVLNQIRRQMDGHAHRGYKGMFIVVVPKELLDQQAGRNKADALGDYLLESPEYGKDGTSDLVVPKEYNFGYLQGNVLNVNKNFA